MESNGQVAPGLFVPVWVGAVLALLAPSASASTVSLVVGSDSTTALLRFQARAAESNRMSIRPTGRNDYLVADDNPMVGRGCARQFPDTNWLCRVPDGVKRLKVLVLLGDGNDEAYVDLNERRAAYLVLRGGAGNDMTVPGGIRSHAGRSLLSGGPGADDIGGFGADETVHGGAGDDFLTGAKGDDKLLPGPGRDTVLAGDGNDSIRSEDGWRDELRCGRGRDTTRLDRADVLRERHGCEVVRTVGARPGTRP